MRSKRDTIELRINDNTVDNPTDSLTTYSLMTVLAGTFFVTLLVTNTNSPSIFLSDFDKVFILTLLLIVICLILLSIEIVIDIFHFTFNNVDKEVIKKYRRQLRYYNLGVILLISSFIYSFWNYAVNLVFNNIDNTTCLCEKYIVLMVLFIASVFFTTRKWQKDIGFINRAEIKFSSPPTD